jgi:hypothetical protein
LLIYFTSRDSLLSQRILTLIKFFLSCHLLSKSIRDPFPHQTDSLFPFKKTPYLSHLPFQRLSFPTSSLPPFKRFLSFS